MMIGQLIASLLMSFTLGACSHLYEQQDTVAKDSQPQAGIWFKGKPQAALAEAKSRQKPLFVYWGAVWCPLCNELKAEVFSKPRFARLMEDFIPLYLDGDTEDAQLWGERWGASGYPTVLILSPEGQELYRLNTALSESEFHAAVSLALHASSDLSAALSRVEEDKATEKDFKILARSSWEKLPADRLLQTGLKAWQQTPSSLVVERSLLASALLSLASTQGTVSKAADKIRQASPKLLDAILDQPEGVVASRAFVVQSAGSSMRWLFAKPEGDDYAATKSRWLAAANLLAADSQQPITTRLEAHLPAVELQRWEQPEGQLSGELRSQVGAAAAAADKAAKTSFERQACISTAAYLLRQVGDPITAKELLLREAARSSSPWYYYSSLASLELELNHDSEAQKWAAKARETTEGRASKIQWIVSDILLNAKIKNAQQRGTLLRLSHEYYAEATSLSDGFVGRNGARAKKVAEVLGSWRQDAEFRKIWSTFARRCGELGKEGKISCEAHFAGLNS